MKTGIRSTVLVAAAAAILALSSGAARAEAPAKNWSAPAQKILAQKLSDEIMAAHPELLSVTFHGVPPGLQDVYTMFAGSYPERIGNPDDPDDIDVTRKGITILDPRWHRTKDKDRKFVILMPLRDARGENVGLLVLAYRDPEHPSTSAAEEKYFHEAAALRDALSAKIPSYAGLFDPAR